MWQAGNSIAWQKSVSPMRSATTASASNSDDYTPPPYQPWKYTHLWVSADGETHIAECAIEHVKQAGFTGDNDPRAASYPAPLLDGTKVIVNQMPAGNVQQLHPCPHSQFVTVLSGSWYVETTDGTRREFKVGEVMFQDNTEDSPAAKTPQHASGVVGEEPCIVLISQAEFKETVDKPGPFKRIE
ncbi:hypothetical protein WJX73_007671 [Symbiochloris irregularis]|uniref:Cupin 2 conserved barrel domain-containing protein n=1 Tax=Symbiochloris irregularis TaxID=706552 RepID=A0AAW1PF61_9CHLO